MMIYKKSLVIILLLQISLVEPAKAENKCNCNIFPFEPAPPCFKACYVIAASKSSAKSLQEFLGINQSLATKISGLSEIDASLSKIGAIWQSSSLNGSDIKLNNGGSLGKLVGYYKSLDTNQIRFAVDSGQKNSLLGIPIEGVLSNENQTISILPHVPVYVDIDQPTFTGDQVKINRFPDWSPGQPTKNELIELRKKMEQISSDDFYRMIDGVKVN